MCWPQGLMARREAVASHLCNCECPPARHFHRATAFPCSGRVWLRAGRAAMWRYAVVGSALKEDADRAVTDKNGAKLLGRVLAVSSAKQRVPLEQRKTPLAERQGKKGVCGPSPCTARAPCSVWVR
jgi:hypothetical protein